MTWGSLFRATAKATKVPLVLWLSDLDSYPDTSLRSSVRMLMFGGYDLRVRQDAWVGTPNRLVLRRSQTVSRFALRDLARQASKWSGPGIEDWAAYFSATPQGSSNLIEVWFRMRTGVPLRERSRAVTMLWKAIPDANRPSNGKPLAFALSELTREGLQALFTLRDLSNLRLTDEITELSRER